ncbi:SMI1/KNR4 family protein [Flectobacillus roseus]|uniref:SMI1/KNR4 family protein n=1 Tax=Flectobacillus roseus TaxID=502259 RepID=A0ABT6YFE2_9BACT|nr:SMI1/KNR4 family protein [Flectobacillus roseus]MDI9862290.1 SMI1/KNR4 family protein [Flectobacillus roseus]
MEKFEEILSKYETVKRSNKPRITFEEVEKIIGFKLPEDYKSYAIKYSEFEDMIGEQNLRLWNFDEILEINEEYEIFEYLPKTLGIGDNGSGEFIAIEKLKNRKIRIVLSPFIIEQDAHIEIGNSFTNFLERLEDGIEWFD